MLSDGFPGCVEVREKDSCLAYERLDRRMWDLAVLEGFESFFNDFGLCAVGRVKKLFGHGAVLDVDTLWVAFFYISFFCFVEVLGCRKGFLEF